MADRFTVRAVVIFLGCFALAGLAVLTVLLVRDKDATLIAGLTGTALGSLATLLATTKAGPTEEQLRELAAAVAPSVGADGPLPGDVGGRDL